MSHWTSHVQDRWLWLGLGAITFFAVPVVAHALRTVLHLTAVTPDADEPLSVVDISVTQSKEDAINLDTIKVLTRCPNHEIRSSALKMLLRRACKDTTTLISLHKDLSSSDTDVHSKAELSHDLLKQHLMQCPFEGLRVWRICAAKNTKNNKANAADTADANSTSPTNTIVPDADAGTSAGVGAGAGAGASPDSDLLLQPTQKVEKLEDTCPVCSYAFNSSSGSNGSNGISIFTPIDDYTSPYYRDRNVNANANANADREGTANNLIMSIPLRDNSTSPFIFERRGRLHAESPEEVALRRRRREAIVLNDGNRPVVQEDIIQRGVGGVRVSTNET